MEKKQVNRLLFIVVFIIFALTALCHYGFGQSLNPTFQSVTLDSAVQRGTALYISDGSGSVAYLRTSGDSLFMGDVTGEKYLGTTAAGVTPTNNILEWYAAGSYYRPYATLQANSFYDGTTNPTGTTRLNIDRYLYGTRLYSKDATYTSFMAPEKIQVAHISNQDNVNLYHNRLDIWTSFIQRVALNPTAAASNTPFLLYSTSARNSGVDVLTVRDFTQDIIKASRDTFNVENLVTKTRHLLADTATADFFRGGSGGSSSSYEFFYNSASTRAAFQLEDINETAVSVNHSGTLTSDNFGNVLSINRTYAGSVNTFGDLISISDNITASGVNSTSILTAEVDNIERINLNPRALNGFNSIAYLLDTKNDLTTGTILSLSTSTIRRYDFKKDSLIADTVTAHFKEVVTEKIIADTNIIGGDTITGTITLKEAVESESFDTVTMERLFLGNVPHAIGGFEDSLITITVSASDTWYQVTNATNNAFIAKHGYEVSISGDTVYFSHAGDYRGHLSVTLSGPSSQEYEFRARNVTQDEQVSFLTGITTTGTGNYQNVSVPLYDELNSGDGYIVEVRNVGGTGNPIIRHLTFEAVYLHEPVP